MRYEIKCNHPDCNAHYIIEDDNSTLPDRCVYCGRVGFTAVISNRHIAPMNYDIECVWTIAGCGTTEYEDIYATWKDAKSAYDKLSVEDKVDKCLKPGYIIINNRGEILTNSNLDDSIDVYIEEWYQDYRDAEADIERIIEQTSAVFVGPDTITISDYHGEIVHWIKDEWVDDPDVVTAIANAIKMYYEKGPNTLREIIGKVITSG